MSDKLLQAGKIINTHGTKGEVKIFPWADTPEFLKGFKTLYIGDKATKVISSRVHKDCLIAVLEGIDSLEAAIRLKNIIVYIDKSSVKLEEGRHFIADLIGLTAVDYETGEELGKVAEVLTLPSNNVYVIKGKREILVPAVAEFIKETDLSAGIIKMSLIEGM